MVNLKYFTTVFIIYPLFILPLASCKSFSFNEQKGENNYSLQGLFDSQHLLRLKQVDGSAILFRFEVCPFGASKNQILEQYCVSALQTNSGDDIIFSVEMIQEMNLTAREKQELNDLHVLWMGYRDDIIDLSGREPRELVAILGGSFTLGNFAGYATHAASYKMSSDHYFKRFGVRNVEQATKELNQVIKELKLFGLDVSTDLEPTLSTQEFWYLKENSTNKFSVKFHKSHYPAISALSQSGLSTDEQVLAVVRNFVRNNSFQELVNANMYERFLSYYQLKYSTVLVTPGMPTFCGVSCLEQAFKQDPKGILDELDRFIMDRGRVKKYFNERVLTKLGRMEQLLEAVAVKRPANLAGMKLTTGNMLRRTRAFAIWSGGAALAIMALENNNFMNKASSAVNTAYNKVVDRVTGGNTLDPNYADNRAANNNTGGAFSTMSDKLTVMLKTPDTMNALWSNVSDKNQPTEAITSVLKAFVLYGGTLFSSDAISNYCLPESSNQVYSKVCYFPESDQLAAQDDVATVPFKQLSSTLLSKPQPSQQDATAPEGDQKEGIDSSTQVPTIKSESDNESTDIDLPESEEVLLPISE
ncbi:MAG: hypothetical protein OXC40_03025 [Proteobacteria bacterium]|nr:hypothetical protein [Pseudomonadota bacterium]